jgi:uncharacterized protein (TIGR00255 family)
MTGYGRGECVKSGFKVTVEISSVNRKQTEIALNLPRELETLEAPVRDLINQHVARGRVTVRVSVHAGKGVPSARMHINVPLARAYARELRRLAKDLKLDDGLSLDILARAPGVLQTDAELVIEEDFWPAVHTALSRALSQMLRMRQREGDHMAGDLVTRIDKMRKATLLIRKHAPGVSKRYREQLIERIRAAGVAASADEERLIKEVVYFADRSDISEELTRLESHYQQFEDCRKSSEPVGRMLDFLAQEMNREVNTIGSKANDSLISREVVTLKAELERFREQAQNIE